MQKSRAFNSIFYHPTVANPKLNLIERFWQVMNEKVRNNHYFYNSKEFRQHIDDFFQIMLPDIADSLDNRINDDFQRIETAV